MFEALKDFWLIWFLLLILAIYPFFKARMIHSMTKPVAGNQIANLDPKHYRVINRFLIDTIDLFSRIDHIVIAKSGIFVIKTNDYQGTIKGDENDKEWIQALFGLKLRFINPVEQNEKHINYLKKLLSDYPDAHFVSIIVFSEKAKINAKTERAKIIYSQDLGNVISSYKKSVFSEEECKKIFDQIAAAKASG